MFALKTANRKPVSGTSVSDNLLVDTLARQAMVMIARIAVSGGKRVPLSHLADHSFFELCTALQRSGLSQQVIADMFGITLRAYQYKMRRLAEGSTSRRRSLWQAIMRHLQQTPNPTRGQILQQFAREDSAIVAAVLRDLTASGIVTARGSGTRERYTLRAVSEVTDESDAALPPLVWVTVYLHGPLSRDALHNHLPRVSKDGMQRALLRLEEERRIDRSIEDGAEYFSSETCVIPVESLEGWQASLLDHFQAVANTIAGKVEQCCGAAPQDPLEGGSTFHFELDEDHPLHDKVVNLLSSMRAECIALWEEVEAYYETHSRRPERVFKHNFYMGQYRTRGLENPVVEKKNGR